MRVGMAQDQAASPSEAKDFVLSLSLSQYQNKNKK